MFVGAIAVLIGVAGLLTPVSVSPERQAVECGTAVSADLSRARALDDEMPAKLDVSGELAAAPDYTELCQKELDDRRLGTLTLTGFGAIVVLVPLAVGLIGRRRRRSEASQV